MLYLFESSKRTLKISYLTLLFPIYTFRVNVLKNTSSKYDRGHDFEVILGSVLPCRKLRWICRKNSNDVAQVEIPGKSTILSRDIIHLLDSAEPDIRFVVQIKADVGRSEAESNISLDLHNKSNVRRGSV